MHLQKLDSPDSQNTHQLIERQIDLFLKCKIMKNRSEIKKFKKQDSFCLYSLLLLLLFVEVSSTSNKLFSGQKEQLLRQRLNQIDSTIYQHEEQSENRQIFIDSKAENMLSLKNTDKIAQLYRKLPGLYFSDFKQTSQQSIKVREKCRLSHKNTDELSSDQLKYQFITSQDQLFIFINDHSSFSLEIYDSNCHFLVLIKDLTIRFIFQQQKNTITYNSNSPNKDKDKIPHQLIYAISSKDQLITIDLAQVKKQKSDQGQTQESNRAYLQNQQQKYRILNNKLILPNQKNKIIGVILKTLSPHTNRQHSGKQNRNVGPGTYKQKQLFIAFDSTQIKVYDEMGTHKITMNEPSAINNVFEEQTDDIDDIESSQNEKSIQLIDHHPYPILLESNWVYFIDTNKYSRHAWGCPFISNIRKIFIQSHLSNEVYVLTTDKIFKINIKSKDVRDQGKKGTCQIQKSIRYFDPQIWNKKRTNQDINFSVHKNLIFLDDLVYNMTSNQYLTVISASNLTGINRKGGRNDYEMDLQCKHFSIHPIPLLGRFKKAPNEKETTFLLHCLSEKSILCQKISSIHILTIISIKSQSSILIYIVIGFVLVIFFAIKFFKSNSSNYEKQLLFPVNFDGDGNEVKKQHYQQLHKYMKEAKLLEQQEKRQNKMKNQPETNTRGNGKDSKSGNKSKIG